MYSRSKKSLISIILRGISGNESNVAAGVGANRLQKGMHSIEEGVSSPIEIKFKSAKVRKRRKDTYWSTSPANGISSSVKFHSSIFTSCSAFAFFSRSLTQ